MTGPEKYSLSALGDYLQLGHKKEGQNTRQSLKNVFAILKPDDTKKEHKTQLYSGFSLLVEGILTSRKIEDGQGDDLCT